jgi:hypothetical protein
MLKQELDQAVEPGVDRDSQKAVSVLARERHRLARSDPGLQLEQPSFATDAEEMLSRRISFRLRSLRSGFGVAW